VSTAAVVGAGWAGLAAAVSLASAGLQVTLLEMAPAVGGRARSVRRQGLETDNGQHILIGAYRSSLALMRQVGVDPDRALLRTPLVLTDARGRGLRLRGGPAALAFPRAVLALEAWTWRDRLALLGRCAAWAGAGFRCDPRWTVDRLCRGLPDTVRQDLLEPLCVAALNTEAPHASATVFLRVLRDALLGGPGSADLLLPRQSLSTLLPEPALAWLAARGASIRLRARTHALERRGSGWAVDGEPFDQVVLACGARETARLVEVCAPAWAETARSIRHQAILTSYVRCDGARLQGHPMLRLEGGPAQFAFDHGLLTGQDGLFAFVASAADDWLDQGMERAEQALLAQAGAVLQGHDRHAEVTLVRSVCERRATFACVAGLQRPAAAVAPHLWAAGDYVEGPYPATLEGAVRSGCDAARAALGSAGRSPH
jgi:squalene-associated FAD-dependent desaturase